MTSPTIDIIALLQQYEALHTAANDNLKSCIFNITKARKVGTSKSCYGDLQYSVDNVREELRAQALLKELKDDISDGIDEEPSLVSEESSVLVGNDSDSSGEISGGNKFVLHLDGMKNAKEQLAAAREEAQEQTNNINTTLDTYNTNEGLRRRHQSTAATTTATQDDTKSVLNEWLTEDAPSSPNNNNEEDEEQQKYRDPLNLFGIPPPALRVAQAKSRCAIAYYVEVANLAREIIRITNENVK